MFHRHALLASVQSGQRPGRLKAWGAEEVILLPLYPQYSTTTTGSSLLSWRQAAGACWPGGPLHGRCVCYPERPRLHSGDGRPLVAWRVTIALEPSLIRRFAVAGAVLGARFCRKRSCGRGDPYPWQVRANRKRR